MNMVTIKESDMLFGPYPDEDCFHVEQSAAYKAIAHDGVTMAEFWLLREPPGQPAAIWIIEAKSSSPRPEIQPNFDEFVEKVRDKWVNALSLGISLCMGRHVANIKELPEKFRALDFAKIDFRLILVIKGHKEEWLPPIKDALAKALRATTKTWAMAPSAVVVLNEQMACKYHLIGA